MSILHFSHLSFKPHYLTLAQYLCLTGQEKYILSFFRKRALLYWVFWISFGDTIFHPLTQTRICFLLLILYIHILSVSRPCWFRYFFNLFLSTPTTIIIVLTLTVFCLDYNGFIHSVIYFIQQIFSLPLFLFLSNPPPIQLP